MRAQLPAALRPRRSDFVVRLGRDNDGGYLVDRRDVEAADCLISLGISDDWSFEKDFVALQDVPVFAYDASVSLSVFRKRLIKALPRLDDPQRLGRSLRILRDYRSFFQGRRQHIPQFVGLDRPPEHVSMSVVLADVFAAGFRRPFVKMDIEGSEYRTLGDLRAHSDRLAGMVVEFHDCDLHLARILAFVAAVDLALVHIHPNNAAPVSNDGIPLLLELSFSSSPPLQSFAVLPHPLDMPNVHRREDHSLVFDGR